MLIQDADLEYSPEEYPLLTELIVAGRADVVYGSRFLGRHRVFLLTHYMGNRLLTLHRQRPLQHDAHRHGDLLQGDAHGRPPLDGAASRTGSASSRRSPPRSSSGATASTRVPISYDGRGYDEGKKITWRDGVVALWVLVRYRFTE